MSGESQLGFVNIWNGIFQGNSFSSFLFINVYVYITATGIAENEMNHLFLMDGLKLNGTNEKETDSLVDTILPRVSEGIGKKPNAKE